MTVRFYSSVATEKTLSGAITAGQTTLVVSNTIGLPASTPYTIAVDYETAVEELVEVTGAAGTTLTITRAIDGTSASTHNSGARVRHVTSARDFADSRNHENASTNIHGLGVGEVIVGTTSVQTLSNKTFVDAQGTFLDPDINLTGTNVTTFTRSPAGAGTVSAVELFNGAERTASIRNDGLIRIQNPVAQDSTDTDRRLSIVMSNGTTERAHIDSGGMATMLPRTGTAVTNGAFKAIDPGDTNLRKMYQLRDSADTTDRFTVFAAGQTAITPSSAAVTPLTITAAAAQAQPYVTVEDNAGVDQFSITSAGLTRALKSARVDAATAATIALDVKGAASQTANLLSVTDSASVDQFTVAASGLATAFKSASVLASTAATVGLITKAAAAQTADIQQWQNSAGTTLSHVRADGSSDFAPVVTTTGIVTAAAGWSVSSQIAVVKAGIATIALRFMRTGGVIAATADGDIADTNVGTVSAAFRPHSAFGANPMMFIAAETTSNGGCEFNPSTGVLQIQSWSGNNGIHGGAETRITMTYALDFA